MLAKAISSRWDLLIPHRSVALLLGRRGGEKLRNSPLNTYGFVIISFLLACVSPPLFFSVKKSDIWTEG